MWYGDCKIRNYISPPPCPVSSPLPSQMQPETEEAMLTHISQLILVACFMISVLRFCTCTKTKTENTHPWAMAYGSIQTPNPSPSPGCGCIAEDQWWLVPVRPRHLRKCKHCPSILDAAGHAGPSPANRPHLQPRRGTEGTPSRGARVSKCKHRCRQELG